MNDLWDWAVRTYAAPGAKVLLLGLQDECGQCVSYLLWAGWMAQAGRQPSDTVLADGAALALRWDTTIVGPLRRVRKALRGGADVSLHDQVLAAELAAEHELLDRLYALAPPAGGAVDRATAVARAAAAWNPVAPHDRLAALVGLLS